MANTRVSESFSVQLKVRTFFYYSSRQKNDVPIIGSIYGMGSLEGEEHKKVRKMMLHTFTPGHIRTLHPTVREYADQYVEVLSKEREQAEYNLLKYKKHIALDISKCWKVIRPRRLTTCCSWSRLLWLRYWCPQEARHSLGRSSRDHRVASIKRYHPRPRSNCPESILPKPRLVAPSRYPPLPSQRQASPQSRIRSPLHAQRGPWCPYRRRQNAH